MINRLSTANDPILKRTASVPFSRMSREELDRWLDYYRDRLHRFAPTVNRSLSFDSADRLSAMIAHVEALKERTI